jgi:ABC-2 type transport system ATP-binding protein
VSDLLNQSGDSGVRSSSTSPGRLIIPSSPARKRRVELVSDSELLVLDGVTKNYNGIVALDGASFRMRRGEIFGYIGPNGAGKTTTIKIMVGLIRDFSGTVSIDAHSIPSDATAVQRAIGYLPQRAAFQDWRTVDQALTTFGRLSGMSRAEVGARIPVVLGLLGIPEARHRKILQLSSGTIQKVGLAQALVHNPSLLVLDEPMSGLDPSSRYQFKEIFRRLRDQGTTIFFSSHILGDVQDIADRIGILNHGRILHVGTVDQLQSRLEVQRDVEVVLFQESDWEPEAEVLARLTGLDRPGPGRFLAHLKPEADLDDTINAIIDSLRKEGQRIHSIHPVVPDLEQLYMRFVRGEET